LRGTQPAEPRGFDTPLRGTQPAEPRGFDTPLRGTQPAEPRGFDTPLRGTQPAEREGDEALIVFTSGTTAAPRAVVHTRGSLGAGLADVAATSMRAGQRVVTDQLMVGIPALIAGAHWILPAAGLDPGATPQRYLHLLPDAEVLFTPPAALDAILRLLDDSPHLAPRALETLILGGAPVLRPLLERAFARFPGVTIRAVYGMTEILPVAIADGAEKLARADADGDYVGRLVPSVRARLDDSELVIAGPGLASGYLGEPPLTEVCTGDLARLDGDELVLLGRRKEMFIRGTQNVYPGLYEPVIAGIPGVREAVMTGVPDAIGDDRIVVLVVPESPPARPDPAHPVARAVARALPGLVDAGVLPDLVVAVPDLPRSGRSRKLDRAAIVEIARGLR
ncbi:class I adenylate-forming enzyme family protein, partial [Pseudolysinimonas sp.]|uniref:class I adenylate-forming enzyme family protein n=1 Tax=Pseudolysinimonas sp. TaxID=2680009 RepID=UPI0037842734